MTITAVVIFVAIVFFYNKYLPILLFYFAIGLITWLTPYHLGIIGVGIVAFIHYLLQRNETDGNAYNSI